MNFDPKKYTKGFVRPSSDFYTPTASERKRIQHLMTVELDIKEKDFVDGIYVYFIKFFRITKKQWNCFLSIESKALSSDRQKNISQWMNNFTEDKNKKYIEAKKFIRNFLFFNRTAVLPWNIQKHHKYLRILTSRTDGYIPWETEYNWITQFKPFLKMKENFKKPAKFDAGDLVKFRTSFMKANSYMICRTTGGAINHHCINVYKEHRRRGSIENAAMLILNESDKQPISSGKGNRFYKVMLLNYKHTELFKDETFLMQEKFLKKL